MAIIQRPRGVVGPGDGLVGRGAALVALDRALDQARQGTPTFVLVVGEAGMGKTHVLRAALDRDEIVAITAAGDRSERDLDFGVVEQLLRSSPLDATTVDELVPRPGSDPLAAGARLLQRLDEVEMGRPLVVVIDDLHWADAASLDALTFTARRLRADPVACFLTCRPEGLDKLPPGLMRLIETSGARIELTGLTTPQVKELASEVLGRSVSTVGAERLREHTGGNPLHIRTLLRELPPEALDGAGPLPAPRSYAPLVLARLAACSDDAQRLAAALAVMGTSAPLATVARVAGLDDPLGPLDEVVREKLVELVDRPGERSVAFTHPLVGAAVADDLPPSRRAALHRAAGDVLPGAAGLRHHLAGCGGYDRDLAAEAERVATAEADRGAHGSSARLWAEVARVAPEAAARGTAVLRAVDQMLLAGDLGGAQARRAAVEAAPPGPERSFLLGRLAYVLGPRPEAWSLLGTAWRDVTDERGEPVDRALAGRIAALLATVAVDQARAGRSLEWAQRALELAPAAAADCNPGHMLAMASALRGQIPDGIARLTEALSDPPDHPASVSDLHLGRGVLRLWAHDLPGSIADLDLCLRAWGAGGSLVARETARYYLAEAHYRAGRWDDAIVVAETAASIVDATDQVWLAGFSHAVAVFPLAARGEWERAEAHLAAARAAAGEAGSGAASLWTMVASIRLAGSRGDHAGVVSAGALMDSPRRPVTDVGITPWRADYVEALIALDRIGPAASVVDWLLADAPASTSSFVEAEVARAQVAVAAATGDDASVDAVAEAALAGSAEAPGPYARARLELAVGAAWRHRGHHDRAEPVLEAARARFARLRATPWEMRAERELGRAGRRRPARAPRPAATALTAQEEAVVHLVVQGRTNREVAAELFLSVKTIEHHLSRVYAKLGVRSRTELVRALGVARPSGRRP